MWLLMSRQSKNWFDTMFWPWYNGNVNEKAFENAHNEGSFGKYRINAPGPVYAY